MKKIQVGRDEEWIKKLRSVDDEKPILLIVDILKDVKKDELLKKNIKTVHFRMVNSKITDEDLKFLLLPTIENIKAIYDIDRLENCEFHHQNNRVLLQFLNNNTKRLKKAKFEYSNVNTLTEIRLKIDYVPKFTKSLQTLSLVSFDLNNNINTKLSDCSIKKLSLKHCKIGNNSFDYNIKDIECLKFKHCTGVKDYLKTFHNSMKETKKLENLVMIHTEYNTLDLFNLLKDTKCSNLTLDSDHELFHKLNLDDLEFGIKKLNIKTASNEKFQLLEFIKKCSLLEELNLNLKEKFDDNLYLALKDLKYLKVLSFINIELKSLAKILDLNRLTTIKFLQPNTTFEENFKESLEKNENLKELQFYIPSKGEKYIESIISLYYLERLTLHSFNINNTNFQLLFNGFKKMKQLKFLTIGIYCDKEFPIQQFYLENTSLTNINLTITSNHRLEEIINGLAENKNIETFTINYHYKNIPNSNVIHNLFLSNYTLKKLKIIKSYFEKFRVEKNLIKKYCKRNRDLKKIYSSFLMKKDLYFNFK